MSSRSVAESPIAHLADAVGRCQHRASASGAPGEPLPFAAAARVTTILTPACAIALGGFIWIVAGSVDVCARTAPAPTVALDAPDYPPTTSIGSAGRRTALVAALDQGPAVAACDG